MKNLLFFVLLFCATTSAPAQRLSLSQEKGDTTLAFIAGSSVRSGNAVIAVQVNDTLGGGLNPNKGMFNIGTADDKPLLYLFPQERYTSHFNVRIDGTVYSNDPLRTGAQLLPLLFDPKKLPDGTITCSYQVGRITIEQRLAPEQYTPATGAIRIQYLITNNDVVPHQVGLLLLLDTNINGKDDARVWTSFGFRQGEHQFTAPFMPDYFQAFERNDLTSPGLVAQGTLVGRDAVRPDLVIVGEWFFLRQVQWEYALQNIPFYNDSAVILRWNEKRLAPGERRTVATYYGIGDVTTTTVGQLALSLTAPNRLEAVAGQLTPNPFEVNLIVLNTGSVTATSVQATLDLPSPSLTLASGEIFSKSISPENLSPQQIGTVSWKVLAQCPAVDDTLEFTVNVTTSNPLTNSVSRKIFIPSCAASLPNFTLAVSPQSRTVMAGQAANYTVSMQPSAGFTDNVDLSLFPAIPGVAPAFVPGSINSTTTSTLTLQTSTSLVAGHYNFVILGEGGGLTRSDTVSLVVLSAPDISPPFTINHRPARGATNVPLDTDIQVELLDDLSGVDRASITMQVNGQSVQPTTVTPISRGYLLYYNPPQDFRYNETVQVVIRARDLANPANVMPPDTLRFTAIRDVEPPFATDHQPAKDSQDAPVNTNIALHIRDRVAGVDRASIVLAINGAPVLPTITGNPRDYFVQFDPPQDFTPGQVVEVRVGAADLSFPPNDTSETYSFSIQQLSPDLPDLAATDLRPVGELAVGRAGEVIGEITNFGGVDVNGAFSVQFRVDGGTGKDTTFSRLAAGERVTLRMSLRFQTAGAHEVELVVDPGDRIREVTEANNRQKLVVQISQTTVLTNRLIVRPNPFTPNNDGFNDQVEFDYSGLGLRNPSLQIFDANGLTVWNSHSNTGGRFTWNGRDDRGREVTPGVYLYTLRDQGNNVTSGYVVVAR
jgi:hypothetical protein